MFYHFWKLIIRMWAHISSVQWLLAGLFHCSPQSPAGTNAAVVAQNSFYCFFLCKRGTPEWAIHQEHMTLFPCPNSPTHNLVCLNDVQLFFFFCGHVWFSAYQLPDPNEPWGIWYPHFYFPLILMSVTAKFLAGSPEGEEPDRSSNGPDSKPRPEALLLTLPLPPSPVLSHANAVH